jgi:hypothetical protein
LPAAASGDAAAMVPAFRDELRSARPMLGPGRSSAMAS